MTAASPTAVRTNTTQPPIAIPRHVLENGALSLRDAAVTTAGVLEMRLRSEKDAWKVHRQLEGGVSQAVRGQQALKELDSVLEALPDEGYEYPVDQSLRIHNTSLELTGAMAKMGTATAIVDAEADGSVSEPRRQKVKEKVGQYTDELVQGARWPEQWMDYSES